MFTTRDPGLLKILEGVEDALPKHKKALVAAHETILVEIINHLSASPVGMGDALDPSFPTDFLVDLLKEPESVREKLYDEGLLLDLLDRRSRSRRLLSDLEDALLLCGRDVAHTHFIMVFNNLRAEQESRDDEAVAPAEEKERRKNRLLYHRSSAEGDLKREELRLTGLSDDEKSTAETEIADLRKEIQYADDGLKEIDEPSAFHAANYLREYFDNDMAALGKYVRSGFALAVLVSGRDAQSQEEIMKLFSTEWLRKNIGNVYELSKLLGVLSLDEQCALLGKLKLREFIHGEHFDLVLSGVNNRDAVAIFLRAELRRQDGALALSSRRASISLFPVEAGATEQKREVHRRSTPDAATLERMVQSADKSKAGGTDKSASQNSGQGQSSLPLPHQPEPRSPRKKH